MKLPRPRTRGGAWRIVILVRRIDVAVAASILLHALLFALPGPKPPPPEPPGRMPMQVVIANPVRTPEPAVVEDTAPRPVERPTARPVPRPSTPRVTAPTAKPLPVPPVEEPAPTPAPVPAPAAPPMDMLAMLEARRAQRAAERARLGAGTPGPASEDAAARNLRTLTGGEGVGGVFEITQKNVRTGQYRFNGFRPDQRSQWRELVDVDAGPGGNIEVAMVRSMIELIRKHYSGDFKWDSHRLGRVVTLSARPEDQAGLEEFMMKEFFGNPRNPRG